MSVKWSDVLVQHPAKHAAGAVRSATELPTGATPTRGSTNTPTARAPDARTAQTQRGSQSTGRLYSPSSPRVHVPLATAHTATSPNAHKASRSASHTEERSSATRRDELRRKLTTSPRSTSTATASEPPKPRRRAREPRATPQHQAIAHADTVVSPRGSSTQHGKAPPRKARVYCGQNKLDPSLRVNGGTLEVGTRSRCFRAGFGGALHQRIDDEAEFVRKFTAPYAPLIAQKLWYKDGPPPEGGVYQPATLSQARQRGWGAGSAALARKLQKELHGGSAGAGRTRTRSASASQ